MWVFLKLRLPMASNTRIIHNVYVNFFVIISIMGYLSLLIMRHHMRCFI